MLNREKRIFTVDIVAQLDTALAKDKDGIAYVGDIVNGGLFQYLSSNFGINDGVDIINGWTRMETSQDLLTKLAAIDGTGSGLDADLLDGFDSVAFSRLAATEVATGSKTFSNAVIKMTALPTVNPLVAGQLWSNAGVLTVSAG